jgi:hypothetical protein
MLPERRMMATEKINGAEVARDQAITELRLAILSLQCGEMVYAENHAFAAIAWVREIPSLGSVQGQG